VFSEGGKLGAVDEDRSIFWTVSSVLNLLYKMTIALSFEHMLANANTHQHIHPQTDKHFAIVDKIEYKKSRAKIVLVFLGLFCSRALPK